MSITHTPKISVPLNRVMASDSVILLSKSELVERSKCYICLETPLRRIFMCIVSKLYLIN